MSLLPSSRRRLGGVVVLAASGSLLTGLLAPGAFPDSVALAAETGSAVGRVEPFTATGLPDVDRRVGSVAPVAAALTEASRIGAAVRWNRFGTPQSLAVHGGDLGSVPASASTDAAAAARGWLNSHAALFGSGSGWADGLDLVSDQLLSADAGHAVLFRQRYGTLTTGVDGMVTVGIARGAVTYVSSSIVPASTAPASTVPAPATLSPTAAWAAAAADVGRVVASTEIGPVSRDGDWTVFTVDGFAQLQRARLRSVPSPDGRVVAAYEVNVVDVAGGAAAAYTSLVDARTGAVILRRNQADNLGPESTFTSTFQGTVAVAACAPRSSFAVDSATETIITTASAVVPTNDIVLNLYDPSGTRIAASDTATSPEAITYTGEIVAGQYAVEVCGSSAPRRPFTQPGVYTGVFVASEQPAAAAVPYPPAWRYFQSNPTLNYDPGTTIDNRTTRCWVNSVGGSPVPGCTARPLDNSAARMPWDVEATSQVPSFTTDGNAATTAEAWLSPLSPGGLFQRPVEVDRTYQPTFTDAWNNSRCNPANLVPLGNDILPAVTNLFSVHNRMHDYSYYLGFTEANYNLQQQNFGLTDPAQGLDPEIGNVQAGAISGGAPTYLGRDNANQIALQDGVAGITNQYLFQPIAGSFYAPCVDGDLDMTIVGHEYTHAISNRMVAGPDDGLVGLQAGSMGESWSDQVALEFLFSHGYSTGAGPFIEGPYATGNGVTGIRNYALDSNPLQYGDIGYDVTGPEVHADGEVWSAVMIDVRQALVDKYNAQFPYYNAALQLSCAEGDTTTTPPTAPLPVSQCPGNRRWVQLMFDSFLLQQSQTSMLDARDAFLAADQMRFGGADLDVLWQAFAGNGMGENATSASTEDDQPTADYSSPLGAAEATLTAVAIDRATGAAVKGKLFVGDYEARVTPIADTDPATTLDAVVPIVPGLYNFVFQAPGFGLQHFSVTLTAGKTLSPTLKLDRNVASSTSGASLSGTSVGSRNAGKLIDDSEATNWAGVNPTGVSVDTVNPFVNVDLAGTSPVTVRSVVVSAMLRPGDASDEDAGARFTALRRFAIETCKQSATSNCSSVLPSGSPLSPYKRIYTSPANAFDSTLPRPLAPDLLFRRFDVPDTSATHVRLVALENQCSGTAEYAGEQDADPLNATDCKTASEQDESVRAAELQVYTFK